ncbi:MAG: ribosome-associated translation inhibitor RaiA [Vicinamibacterales bacterium]
MQLVITGRHVEITAGLRRLLDAKVKKIVRLLPDGIVSAQAVIARERHRHLTELSIHARGDHMLTALGDGPSWGESVADAAAKLTQQVHKLKDRRDTRRRRAKTLRGAAPAERAGAAKPRPKPPAFARYPIKPMSVEEAAARLERTGDAFLVFRNAEDETVLVAYRRRNGRTALIDPQA